MIVVTTNDIAGHRVVRVIGLVRGVTVRSRNVIAGFGAQLQSLKGGNITIYTKLAEQARQEAHDLMVAHASEVGANAVLAMRYDANEMSAGITEVLAYGTAVVVERALLTVQNVHDLNMLFAATVGESKLLRRIRHKQVTSAS